MANAPVLAPAKVNLFLHVVGLLGALLVAAALVWWASRFRGYVHS